MKRRTFIASAGALVIAPFAWVRAKPLFTYYGPDQGFDWVSPWRNIGGNAFCGGHISRKFVNDLPHWFDSPFFYRHPGTARSSRNSIWFKVDYADFRPDGRYYNLT